MSLRVMFTAAAGAGQVFPQVPPAALVARLEDFAA